MSAAGDRRETLDVLPLLVNARTVAQRLSLDESTVRKWARTGRLPSYKMGRSVRFDPSEVDEFVRRHYAAARR